MSYLVTLRPVKDFLVVDGDQLEATTEQELSPAPGFLLRLLCDVNNFCNFVVTFVLFLQCDTNRYARLLLI